MAGLLFRQAVKAETGFSWEEWIVTLGEAADSSWSHEQIVRYLAEEHGVSQRWSETIALLYGQRLGRKPTGQTADAGVQIGVRRTLPVTREWAWNLLTSPEGLKLWLGELPELPLRVGHPYESAEGTSGEIRSVMPFEKIRMTYRRKDWERPSIVQIYLGSTSAGKTTISFHQDKLDDVYMRGLMKDYWEEVLDKIRETHERHRARSGE